MFTVTPGEHFWGKTQHEPLIVAVVLPLFHVNGWLRDLMRPNLSPESSAQVSSTLGIEDPKDFLTWKGLCVACGKMRKGGVGLFCANFCVGRESFPPCRNVWCRDCYRESTNDPFPRQQGDQTQDDEKELEMDERDNGRYRRGVDGAQLMGIPFHCDFFAFRDLNFRDPVGSIPKDATTLVDIRRAKLDAMWAREPETVKGNLRQVRRDYTDAVNLYIMVDPLPYLPTQKVGDLVG